MRQTVLPGVEAPVLTRILLSLGLVTSGWLAVAVAKKPQAAPAAIELSLDGNWKLGGSARVAATARSPAAVLIRTNCKAEGSAARNLANVQHGEVWRFDIAFDTSVDPRCTFALFEAVPVHGTPQPLRIYDLAGSKLIPKDRGSSVTGDTPYFTHAGSVSVRVPFTLTEDETARVTIFANGSMVCGGWFALRQVQMTRVGSTRCARPVRHYADPGRPRPARPALQQSDYLPPRRPQPERCPSGIPFTDFRPAGSPLPDADSDTCREATLPEEKRER